MTFDVVFSRTVEQHGGIHIEADSEREAYNQAINLSPRQIDWFDFAHIGEPEVISVEEVDN